MQKTTPQFRFEAGSYGAPGGFMPSIACLKQTAVNKWEYHFVIVDPKTIQTKEQPAVLQAEKDLQAAFQRKRQSGSDNAVGEYLRDKGYINVTGFKIVGS